MLAPRTFGGWLRMGSDAWAQAHPTYASYFFNSYLPTAAL
jgi:hypothetical protein